MHSSRPDCVFGDARLISSTSTTLAKIGPGRNSKRGLALVEDVGADDVGRQQVGGALHARELAVQRARQRAGQRGLADAGEVLDEDVALGDQRDDDVVQHVVAHLDRPADVLPKRAGDRGRRVDLGPATVPSCSAGSISACTLIPEMNARRKTMSKMARAMSAFVVFGTCLVARRRSPG